MYNADFECKNFDQTIPDLHFTILEVENAKDYLKNV